MSSEEHILATRIIKDTFGNSASKVCKVLLLRKEANIHELLKETDINLCILQNCLIILIHFDIAYCTNDGPLCIGNEKTTNSVNNINSNGDKSNTNGICNINNIHNFNALNNNHNKFLPIIHDYDERKKNTKKNEKGKNKKNAQNVYNVEEEENSQKEGTLSKKKKKLKLNEKKENEQRKRRKTEEKNDIKLKEKKKDEGEIFGGLFDSDEDSEYEDEKKEKNNTKKKADEQKEEEEEEENECVIEEEEEEETENDYSKTSLNKNSSLFSSSALCSSAPLFPPNTSSLNEAKNEEKKKDMQIVNNSNLNMNIKYKINIRNILIRLRFAHFSNMIENMYGNIGRIIVVQFFKFHKMSFFFLLNSALNDPYNSIEEIESICEETAQKRKEENKKINEENVTEVFKKLLSANLIIKCDCMYNRNHNNVLYKSEDDASYDVIYTQSAKVRRRKTKGNDGGVNNNNNEKKEKQEKEEKQKGKEKEEEKKKKTSKTNTKNKSESELDFLSLSQFDAEGSSEEEEQVDVVTQGIMSGIFCLNFAVLNFSLCKQLGEEFLVHRMSNNFLAAELFKIFFQNISLNARNQIIIHETPYEEIEEILEENFVEKTKKKINKNHVLRLLQFMAHHPDKVIKDKTTGDRTVYYLDWRNLRDLFRRRIIFNLIKSRCGSVCVRIWSFLAENANDDVFQKQNKRMLYDDQTISEKALLDLRTVRRSMYSLLKNKFVKSYEADCLIGWDRSSTAKHVLLFGVHLNQTYMEVCKSVYKICLNFYDRQNAENLKVFQLYWSASSSSTFSSSSSSSSSSSGSSCLTEKEERQLRSRETAEDILEAKLLQIQTSLITLCEL